MGNMDNELHVGTHLGVATMTISRPEQRNAMTDAMWRRLRHLLEDLSTDNEVRLLVLRGAGGSFCAGADLTEYRKGIGQPAWSKQSRENVSAGVEALRRFSKPAIAAIDGACVGGGVALACACDVRVATSRSQFSIPPARLGLVYPYAELLDLIGVVGGRVARTMLMTAAKYDATNALRLGLVDEIADDLQERLESLVSEFLSVSDLSSSAMKRVCAAIVEQDPMAHELADRLAEQALASQDHADRITALFRRI